MNDRFKFRVWNDVLKSYSVDDHFIDEDGKLNTDGDFYTVEQCTGLKDKNGKLIYEGDIVIKIDTSALGLIRQRYCRVFWHEEWLAWAIETEYGDVYMLHEYDYAQYEIVGNIHENKELLNETDND